MPQDGEPHDCLFRDREVAALGDSAAAFSGSHPSRSPNTLFIEERRYGKPHEPQHTARGSYRKLVGPVFGLLGDHHYIGILPEREGQREHVRIRFVYTIFFRIDDATGLRIGKDSLQVLELRPEARRSPFRRSHPITYGVFQSRLPEPIELVVHFGRKHEFTRVDEPCQRPEDHRNARFWHDSPDLDQRRRVYDEVSARFGLSFGHGGKSCTVPDSEILISNVEEGKGVGSGH